MLTPLLQLLSLLFQKLFPPKDISLKTDVMDWLPGAIQRETERKAEEAQVIDSEKSLK